MPRRGRAASPPPARRAPAPAPRAAAPPPRPAGRNIIYLSVLLFLGVIPVGGLPDLT